jgi:deazaflavin-dependent oxidoreductase (nitroreductase family)
MNSVVRSILESPLHGLLSGSLMLVTYTGRVSDRTFTIPVMYARHGGDLLVYVGGHERKTWWRNLRGGAPVHVHVRGDDLAGVARVVDGESELRADYLERFPRSRRALEDDADPLFVEVTNLQPV